MNCPVCGQMMGEHSCAGGVPASNLPERDHGLVSISEMNRRIAEAVADRDATIMAEQAQAAAMRGILTDGIAALHALESEALANHSRSAEASLLFALDVRKEIDKLLPRVDAALQPDAGAKLLADHAAELAAYRNVLEPFHDSRRVLDTIEVADSHPVYVIQGNSQWLVSFAGILRKAAEALESSDAGKALLDAHAAEIRTRDESLAVYHKQLASAWYESNQRA